ncbi:hypothetical protein SBA3_1040018 [Candidatus Sulfopaludibacter sp. SbA3]|nr:hypothetical protein SBA3_1040018 [Candidatus Sulfopaludibacter sp. SbA3]
MGPRLVWRRRHGQHHDYIGELALDVYDPTSKQIVWRGAASKTLDAKAKPEKRQKNLTKGVAKLLKNFPPPPPKSK